MTLNNLIPILKDGLVVILGILILVLSKKKKNKNNNTTEEINEVEQADLQFTKEMIKESFITIFNGIVKSGIPAEKTYNLMINELKKDKKEIIKKGAEDEKNSEINKN